MIDNHRHQHSALDRITRITTANAHQLRQIPVSSWTPTRRNERMTVAPNCFPSHARAGPRGARSGCSIWQRSCGAILVRDLDGATPQRPDTPTPRPIRCLWDAVGCRVAG
jgi:hypothetical protein